jgi:hypothetical protein
MSDFIWNALQQSQIAEAQKGADQANRHSGHQAERIQELERAVQRLTLVSQALWEVLRGRLNIPEQELIAKIGEIDLRDGSKDGRIGHQVLSCPKCSRNLNTKNTHCVYCGAPVQKPHVFQ